MAGSRATVQSPAAYSNQNLAGAQIAARMSEADILGRLTGGGVAGLMSRAQLRARLADGSSKFEVTAAETAQALVAADLDFGFSSGDQNIFDCRRFKVVSDGATDQTLKLQVALNVAAAAGGGVVVLPAGQTAFANKITVPSTVHLVGASMGFGAYVSSVLKYTGSGIAIQVDGYYSRLADFTLKQAGTGTVGIYITATQFMMERVTVMPDNVTGFSTANIQTITNGLIFTHIYRRVYSFGGAIGLDLSWGNNFVVDGCFLESNGTNLRVGWTGAVTNLVVCGGSVIETFGDGRGAETNASIGVDIIDVKAWVIRDSYFETDGTGTPAANGQIAVNVRNCGGGLLQGNYLYGGGQALTLINVQAAARAVHVDVNHFANVAGYAVTEAVGSTVTLGINSLSVGTGIINRTVAPVATSLAVVNGTGGNTNTCTWERIGNRVLFTLRVQVTGTATTAATQGTTYFTLPSSMPAPAAAGVCMVVRESGAASYGTGLIASNSRVYPPAWTAVNDTVVIEGAYRVAA